MNLKTSSLMMNLCTFCLATNGILPIIVLHSLNYNPFFQICSNLRIIKHQHSNETTGVVQPILKQFSQIFSLTILLRIIAYIFIVGFTILTASSGVGGGFEFIFQISYENYNLNAFFLKKIVIRCSICVNPDNYWKI